MHLDQDVETEFGRGGGQLPRGGIIERRHDQQDAIGAEGAAFQHLIRVEDEILAQHR